VSLRNFIKAFRNTLEWLDECGHAAMMEHPEMFGRLLGKWWQGHIQPQRPSQARGAVK